MSSPSAPLHTTRRDGARFDPAPLLPAAAAATAALVVRHPALLTAETGLSDERLLWDLPGLLVQQWSAELLFFALGVLTHWATTPNARDQLPVTASRRRLRWTALMRGRVGAWASIAALHLALLGHVHWTQLLPSSAFVLLGYWLTAAPRRRQHVIDKRRHYTVLAVLTWLMTSCASLTATLNVNWDLSVVLPLHDSTSLAWQVLYTGSTAAWILTLAGHAGAGLAHLRSLPARVRLRRATS